MYLALGFHGEQQMIRVHGGAVRHHFFPSGFEYTLLGSFEKKSLMYFATLRFVTSSTFGFVAFALISFSIICQFTSTPCQDRNAHNDDSIAQDPTEWLWRSQMTVPYVRFCDTDI
jgi:hypothetical protein